MKILYITRKNWDQDMKLKVDGEKLELPENSTVSQVLETLDHHQDSVIVLDGETPLPLDRELSGEEDLKIISVVSGG